MCNDIMGNKKEVVLPTHNDDEELANRFGDFFLGKIETIRDNLKASRESLHSPDVLSADVKFEGFQLTNFRPTPNFRFYHTNNHSSLRPQETWMNFQLIQHPQTQLKDSELP